VAQLSERNKRLKELAINQEQLRQWIRESHKEASWRNDHELKIQIAWAHERHVFMQKEIDDALLPPKTRPTPPPDTPPIVSHQIGRGNKHAHVYGETFG
jgi:hypothetical protein